MWKIFFRSSTISIMQEPPLTPPSFVRWLNVLCTPNNQDDPLIKSKFWWVASRYMSWMTETDRAIFDVNFDESPPQPQQQTELKDEDEEENFEIVRTSHLHYLFDSINPYSPILRLGVIRGKELLTVTKISKVGHERPRPLTLDFQLSSWLQMCLELIASRNSFPLPDRQPLMTTGYELPSFEVEQLREALYSFLFVFFHVDNNPTNHFVVLKFRFRSGYEAHFTATRRYPSFKNIAAPYFWYVTSVPIDMELPAEVDDFEADPLAQVAVSLQWLSREHASQYQ
eukprot:GILJ01031373.1.p1 GENE.GILJ01031373.1~~GILJ01031373.1.p1  ORF type:complete len:284 (-),score=21.77 GILJ01031373.1:226-1077(-)